MRYGRRFSLPIDPWPQASLGERMSVGLVLTLLLLVPFCAASAVMVVSAAIGTYIAWSYDLGASLRGAIERQVGKLADRHGRTVRKA
ncbi:hypothetical protein FV242_05430 [Methylobacterium sp. WL64]|uniref:hypothetical protein n=1 Tax=Methylobacterium sp. WL64 TaxID=2603894 RepID=UPI0011C9EFE1|nr:hypothetical protein [Methylobacterium sp. WL64]TXN05074.1 hypothetical protein FV242_05430 [Methylobacterium sp. WL64]